ncbi:MAG: fatty acid desaturase [Planctomycetota bacterium]
MDDSLNPVSLPSAPTPQPEPAKAERGIDHRDEHFHRLPAWIQGVNAMAVVLPFAGIILAAVLLWGWGFSWVHAGILAGMYLVTAVGITVGYHRLFTHKSFETGRIMTSIMAVLGAMALEGPVLKWVATHRLHHQHSDDHADPHSPHHHGEGIIGMLMGLYHAHMGWLLRGDPKKLYRYVPDLSQDRLIRVLSDYWFLWFIIGLIIPTVLGGLLTMSWWGAFLGFVWGGLVRVFLVHHVTWSINSVCHMWGTRPFASHDESRNNVIFGILGLGEGWHNNHHAFPTSARHGLRWWEFDASYILIRVMEKLGLAWNVRVPSKQRLEAKANDR